MRSLIGNIRHRRLQIRLKVGFVVLLLVGSSANADEGSPMPPWVVKGMEATLTLEMPTHTGVIAQALELPFADDIIVDIEPMQRPAIASQLLRLLNDQTTPPDAVATALRALARLGVEDQPDAI